MKERKTVQYQLDRIEGIAEDVLSLHRFGYNRVSPYSLELSGSARIGADVILSLRMSKADFSSEDHLNVEPALVRLKRG